MNTGMTTKEVERAFAEIVSQKRKFDRESVKSIKLHTAELDTFTSENELVLSTSEEPIHSLCTLCFMPRMVKYYVDTRTGELIPITVTQCNH